MDCSKGRKSTKLQVTLILLLILLYFDLSGFPRDVPAEVISVAFHLHDHGQSSQVLVSWWLPRSIFLPFKAIPGWFSWRFPSAPAASSSEVEQCGLGIDGAGHIRVPQGRRCPNFLCDTHTHIFIYINIMAQEILVQHWIHIFSGPVCGFVLWIILGKRLVLMVTGGQTEHGGPGWFWATEQDRCLEFCASRWYAAAVGGEIRDTP